MTEIKHIRCPKCFEGVTFTVTFHREMRPPLKPLFISCGVCKTYIGNFDRLPEPEGVEPQCSSWVSSCTLLAVPHECPYGHPVGATVEVVEPQPSQEPRPYSDVAALPEYSGIKRTQPGEPQPSTQPPCPVCGSEGQYHKFVYHRPLTVEDVTTILARVGERTAVPPPPADRTMADAKHDLNKQGWVDHGGTILAVVPPSNYSTNLAPIYIAEQIFFHVLLKGGEGNPFRGISSKWFSELAAVKVRELLTSRAPADSGAAERAAKRIRQAGIGFDCEDLKCEKCIAQMPAIILEEQAKCQ